MKLNFGHEVLVLPASVLSSNADPAQLRILLWLASDLSLAQKSKHKQLAKLADCEINAVRKALRFWSENGVLIAEEGDLAAVPVMAEVHQKAQKSTATEALSVPKKHLQRADELPNYSMTELAELMEKRASLRALINEAQDIIGKIFNPSELNILVGMYDYLGIGEEAILLLLAHCKNIGKTNLRAIEKYAYKLLDRGINTASAFEEEFRAVEAMQSFEGEVRALFGMKARALTSREEKMLRAWVGFGYGIDVVRRAYEITVNATNEPSLPYTNAILERWNADGLKTAEDINRALTEAKEKKEGKKTSLGNSFDTDDFFEAALKRSFSDTNANT